MEKVISDRSETNSTCRFRRIKNEGFRLAVELTRCCNLKCRHCFVIQDNHNPSLEEIKRILKEAIKAGCRKVILSGGEPLLRNNLEDIIKVCASNNVLVDLNSNLINLTHKKVQSLLKAGLSEVSVSIYGDESIHDWLTGTKGSYKKTINGIKILRNFELPVDVHSGLTDYGLDSISSLVKKCEVLSISSLTFYTILPVKWDTQREFEFKICKDKAINKIDMVRNNSTIPIRTIGFVAEDLDECMMGNEIFGLNADLKLQPCLLAQNDKVSGIDLKGRDFISVMMELRHEVYKNEWKPACI